MPRRPVIIILITIGYLASPFFILLQGALVHGIPLFGPGSIAARLFFTDIIILFFYPVVAAAVFSVRKWGWYLFIAGVLVLIGYNVFVFFLSPLYNYILLILYNLALAVVAGLLFRKHVIAPYFNPRLRWWESEPRYRIDIDIVVRLEKGDAAGDILDISSGGCYIELDHTCRLGKVYGLRIRCMSHRVDMRGKVMRVDTAPSDKNRYGVMFVKTDADQKVRIDSIMAQLNKSGLRNTERDYSELRPNETLGTPERKSTKPRYIINHSAIIERQHEKYWCRILDISMHGCRLLTTKEYNMDYTYSLSISCMKNELTVDIKLNWKTNRQGAVEYGVSFIHQTESIRVTLKKILHSLKKIGAQDRLKSASPLPDSVLDEKVADTPYRAVLFLKKLVGK